MEELIEEDAVVREKWEHLSMLHIPSPPAPWQEVIDFEAPSPSIFRKIMPWAAAAAVMALVALAAWKFDFFAGKKPAPIAAVNNDVLLQVDGEPLST